MRVLFAAAAAVVWLSSSAVGAATLPPVIVYADIVIKFHDSGAGPIPGPYGAVTDPAQVKIPLGNDFSFATDADPNTSLSLPTGSFLILGFDAPILDGPGDEIFVTEAGDRGERATVFAAFAPAGGFGALTDADFVEIGEAGAGVATGFDIAGKGFAKGITAVKVVGLGLEGDSPGFDLAFVSALFRAPAQPEGPTDGGPPPVAPVPVPAPIALMALGLVVLGAAGRRRR